MGFITHFLNNTPLNENIKNKLNKEEEDIYFQDGNEFSIEKESNFLGTSPKLKENNQFENQEVTEKGLENLINDIKNDINNLGS